MNRPKQKGTAAETAVVRWAKENGFPDADRLTLSGASDRGDVRLLQGVIVEVKAHASAASGQPGAKQLAGWLGETARETANAGASHGVLVVKRKGTADPAHWWAYASLAEFVTLVGGYWFEIGDADWVCLEFGAMARLILGAHGLQAARGES